MCWVAMLYLIDVRINKPAGISAEEWGDLTVREKEYGMKMRRKGKLLHVWRKAGANAAVGIWDVETHDELNELQHGLPFFPFLEITATPLIVHHSTPIWE